MSNQYLSPIIVDGQLRRCGLLPSDPTKVKALPVFEDFTANMLSDSDIHDLITDPNRIPSRKVFDGYWILNQGQWGSCNGHALAAVLQRARWDSGIYDKLRLSGAYVYSKINGGNDNGSALVDDLQEVITNGIAPDQLVLPSMIYPNLQPPTADAEAAKHKGLKPFKVQTIQGLRSALARRFKCVIAMMVGNFFQNLDQNGIAGFDRGPGNHALCCDDLVWNTALNMELFDVPNSWGTDFGQEGRLYATANHFSQTFSQHVFLAVPGITEIV